MEIGRALEVKVNVRRTFLPRNKLLIVDLDKRSFKKGNKYLFFFFHSNENKFLLSKTPIYDNVS